MTHPYMTEEHELFRQSVRRFVEKELKPYVDEWEEQHNFPNQILKRMGDLGFLGVRYPEKYGGSGGDYFMSIVLAEELALTGISAPGAAVGIHAEMAITPIYQFGSDKLKEKYLIPAIRGEKIACLGITEPNAGSDVSGIRTKAVKDGDEWIINGTKMFITNGCRANFVVLIARTSEGKGHKNFSVFVVDTDLPGFSSNKLDKLGTHSTDNAELVLEEVRVPAENMIGEQGQGFHYIMFELQGERVIGAANMVASAQLALETAIQYAKERVQFGRPIADFQVIRHKLAEMATDIEAARELLYNTTWKIQQGNFPKKEISMCKLVAAQTWHRVCDTALQIHGGYGYMSEYPIQRMWRDSRLSRIAGGTDEIMKEIIAKELLK